MIEHAKLNLCIHAPNLRILDQNFNSAHEIHCLDYMTNMSFLESYDHRFLQNLVIIYKTSQNSQLRFRVDSNTFKF